MVAFIKLSICLLSVNNRSFITVPRDKRASNKYRKGNEVSVISLCDQLGSSSGNDIGIDLLFTQAKWICANSIGFPVEMCKRAISSLQVDV
jgi:hypothetical protein